MLKRIFTLLFLAVAVASCSKSNKNSGCDASKMCTTEFASIGVQFVDKAGKFVEVKDITVTNQRTNAAVIAKGVIDPGFSPDFHVIATDNNKNEFSTLGDDVQVSAVSIATGKQVSAIVKISGGCNCHIVKTSGPDKIVFGD